MCRNPDRWSRPLESLPRGPNWPCPPPITKGSHSPLDIAMHCWSPDGARQAGHMYRAVSWTQVFAVEVGMAKVAGHLLLVSGGHIPGQAMAREISPVCPLSPGEPWAPAMPVIPGNPMSPSAPFSPKNPLRPGTRDLLCVVLFLQRTHADMYDCVCCLPNTGAASGCSHNQEMRGGELLSLSSSSVTHSCAVALKSSVICCSPLGPCSASQAQR